RRYRRLPYVCVPADDAAGGGRRAPGVDGVSGHRGRPAEQPVRLRGAGRQERGSLLHGVPVVLERGGALPAAVRCLARDERGRAAGAQRHGLRPHRMDLSLANAGVPGTDARARRQLGDPDRAGDPVVAVAAALDRDRFARVSRLLHRAPSDPSRPSRALGRAGVLLVISRPARDRIAAGLFACLVAFSAIFVVWSMRQGWAVYKLRRGVGDTWFYAADGRAWFRMDEQRRGRAPDPDPPGLHHDRPTP